MDMVHASIFSGANFKKVLEFYQIVLNMRVVYEMSVNLRFVALSFDEENHRIGLVKSPIWSSDRQTPPGSSIPHGAIAT